MQSRRRRTAGAQAMHTVEAHAKKRPACLLGALGVMGFDGPAVERATFPHQKVDGRPGVSGL
eukprot:9226148-Pyramimonas_sp.AAC.1